MPSADLCHAIKAPCDTFSPESETHDRSPAIRLTAFNAQPPNLQPAPLMDMDFAVSCPARPAPYASYPVFVHRLASLLHASFRPHLAMTPLRFAITSPPSGCEEDLHLQAVNHARRTTKRPPASAGGLFLMDAPLNSEDRAAWRIQFLGNKSLKLAREILRGNRLNSESLRCSRPGANRYLWSEPSQPTC